MTFTWRAASYLPILEHNFLTAFHKNMIYIFVATRYQDISSHSENVEIVTQKPNYTGFTTAPGNMQKLYSDQTGSISRPHLTTQMALTSVKPKLMNLRYNMATTGYQEPERNKATQKCGQLTRTLTRQLSRASGTLGLNFSFRLSSRKTTDALMGPIASHLRGRARISRDSTIGTSSLTDPKSFDYHHIPTH